MFKEQEQIDFVTGNRSFLYPDDMITTMEYNSGYKDRFKSEVINEAKKYAMIEVIEYLKTTKMNDEINYHKKTFSEREKRTQISRWIQQCYTFVNILPLNYLFDAGIRNMYTRPNNTEEQKNCFCLCSDANNGWRRYYLNDRFPLIRCPAKKQKPQGLISHLYHKAYKDRIPCPFHATAYFYLFHLYGGKEDVRRSKLPPSSKKRYPALFNWRP